MKIKRLEILGFKSFVDRVTLDFQDGVTGVVGPNGCGKSNIVDAIRWAMGEQSAKNLRGKAMEDIIFGGSESRKPTSRAEVSLTFSTEGGGVPAAYRDYPEIMITRRLYRTGESEYLINKTPCRLLDITELFMDTGAGARAYSMVEQGKIGQILSAKPEERRTLIEEAAGVTKYKARKKTAQRKMEATRQNLLRISDIISEVRRQMNSLKRQAQKAEQFRGLREQARELEVGLASQEYLVLEEKLATVRGEGREQADRLTEAATRLEQQDLQLEEARLVQVSREKEYNEGQQKVLHLSAEMQRLEGELTLGEKEKESLQRQKERLQAEQGEAVLRLEQMAAEEVSLAQLAESIGTELAAEEELLNRQSADLNELADEEQKKVADLDLARNAMLNFIKEQNRLVGRVQEVNHRLTALEERQARLRSESAGLMERQEEVTQRRSASDNRLHDLRLKRQGVGDRQQELASILARHKDEREQVGLDLQQLRDDLSRTASRLESLEELDRQGEGLDEGLVRLREQPRFAEALGAPVAQILDVPAELETALEAALGDRLAALTSVSFQDACDAVDVLLKEGGFGCFHVGGVKPLPTSGLEGARPLAELVRARPGQEERVATLLNGMALVDSLQPFVGKTLAAGTVLVTPQGMVLTGRGEVRGGQSDGVGSGLLQRKRELKDLQTRLVELQDNVSGRESWLQRIKDAQVEAEEETEELQLQARELDKDLVDAEKEQARLHQEESQLNERVDLLTFEGEQLHEEQQGLIDEKARVEAERQEDERLQQVRQEEVERLQEELQVQRRELEQLREQVTSRRVTVAGLRERSQSSRRDLEQLKQQRSDLTGRQGLLATQLEQGASEVVAIDARKEKYRTELDVLLEKRAEEQKAVEALRDQFEEHQQQVEQQQEAYRALRGQVDGLRETLSNLQLRERELSLEQDHLRQSVEERYRLDLTQEPVTLPDDWDEEVARRKLHDLQARIDRLGEVNLTAIDEFRELEERFTFLTAQQDDLQQSLDELQQAIARINRTTRQRFKETFDKVNETFKQVFPRLFRGGRAQLMLTDESDLLETGVDIHAQPPGKRLQNVNLLSGGEKALTAVALIFSLFMIKPSPYCLLDEVDAPLDDANIGRFAEMIREMAKGTQFIVITHNKQTMEGADVMYGVTMEEPGVSKIVSVRMNAA